MKKIIGITLVLGTILLSIMGFMMIMNLKLNEKYVYDSSLPNGNLKGIAEVMKQDVSSMTYYIIALVVGASFSRQFVFQRCSEEK